MKSRRKSLFVVVAGNLNRDTDSVPYVQPNASDNVRNGTIMIRKTDERNRK